MKYKPQESTRKTENTGSDLLQITQAYFSKNLNKKAQGIYRKLIKNSQRYAKLTNRNTIYALELSN